MTVIKYMVCLQHPEGSRVFFFPNKKRAMTVFKRLKSNIYHLHKDEVDMGALPLVAMGEVERSAWQKVILKGEQSEEPLPETTSENG